MPIKVNLASFKKLSKDQVQKISLSCLLACALIYGYFNFLIGPLDQADARNRAGIAELAKKIGGADKQLRKFRADDQQSKVSTATIAEVNALIPEGEPIAWFPPRLKAFFERHGVHDVTARLDRREKLGDPDLDKFAAVVWSAELPDLGLVPFAETLASLENEEPLLEITHLQINTVPDNPEVQRISLNFLATMH